MKKKVLSLALAVCMAFGGAAALPAGTFTESTSITASADKSGDYTYKIENNAATITDYNGSAATLSIPSTLGGKKVTTIGESAFYYCKSLTSVTIPNTVTTIGDTAFYSCETLATIGIPSSVTNIGSKVFRNTKWLENKQKANSLVVVNSILVDGSANKNNNVTIPSGVKKISADALYSNYYLKNVTIPASVTDIGETAFGNCDNLQNIYVNTSNKYFSSINGALFNKGKTRLVQCPGARTSFSIPSGINYIDDYAFFGNNNLTSVSIPSSVKRIGREAFANCTSLKSVNIPYGVTTIGLGAFAWCRNISSINLPKSVTSLGTDVFTSCTSLKSLVLPNSLKEIPNFAFWGCTNLASVTIPSSVTRIGAYAFAHISGLKTIVIPSTVTTIDNDAFIECVNLKNVTIPSSVKEIGDNAFGYESSTKKISGFRIYCYKSTAAVTYASKNGLAYTIINPAVRLSGNNRYGTAAAISKATYPNTNSYVFIANGDNFVDALAGVPLAKAYNAPILLTKKDTLPDATSAEIKRLKASKVIILGGDSAVSNKIVTALTKLGIKSSAITRVKGKSRYDTSVQIAKALKKKAGAPTEMFFTSSVSFADALSVSSVAGAKNAPIIYLPKSGPKINADVTNYVKSMKGTIKQAYVIGGSSVISDAVYGAATNWLGLKKDNTIKRVSGKNRYATCVAVNKLFASTLTGKNMCVATGANFPDALTGGVFAARNKAPLFLTSGSLSAEQKSLIKTRNPNVFYVFGGTGTVSDGTVQNIAKAAV